MHLLPTNLAPLADLAARDAGRYALTGVHLTVRGDNTYRAAGTDGRRLLVVSGPCVGDPTAFPDGGPIARAPNGRSESIVPAALWRKTFKAADKLARKAKGALPCVAAVVGQAVTSFAAAGPAESSFDQHPNVDGRFPPYPDVIPAAAKAVAAIDVDAGLLADLVCAVEAFTDDEARRVRVEFHGRGGQGTVVLRAERTGQSAVGLVVALAEPEGGGPAASAPAAVPLPPVKPAAKGRGRAAGRVAELEELLAVERAKHAAVVRGKDERIAQLMVQVGRLPAAT